MPDTRTAPLLAENLMYIEQVKYTEPYGLQLTGGDDQRMQTFLAQMGLKSEQDLVETMRTVFHPKDRDIVLPEGGSIRTGGGSTPFACVPIGFIGMFSGSIADVDDLSTTNCTWSVCDGTNGTPDLRDRFVIGAGLSFAEGTSGGITFDPLIGLLVDLEHTHGPGSLGTDSDNHSHSSGTLDTDNDSHTHSSGSLDTDSHGHFHAVLGSQGVTAGAIPVVSSLTNDNHDHAVNAGSTASDSHDHAVNAGSTGSDSHGHSVTTGSTALAGSALTDITPPWHALLFIQRIS